jgi:hypothetical protein
MIPEPAYLENMLRWFHVGEDPVVVIGYRKFVDTTALSADEILRRFDAVRALPEVPAPSAVRVPDAPTEDWRNETFQRTRLLKDHHAPYLLASGGNVAFRKRDADRVGGYHAGFQKWGGEDADFAYRLERLGAYFIAEPGGLAYHQDHPAAVVREEDQKTTRELLGRRVPRLRSYTSAEVSDYELPLVTLAIIDDDRGPLEETLSGALSQDLRDLEVLIVSSRNTASATCVAVTPNSRAGERAALALERARGEMVMFVQPGQRLHASALEFLSWALRADPALGFVVGGEGERAFERFSQLDHLRGRHVGCPILLRMRDVARAGGVDRSLGGGFELDLTLRMLERAEARAFPLAFATGLARLDPLELEAVVQRALARRRLDWSVEGWPPVFSARHAGIDGWALGVRRLLERR